MDTEKPTASQDPIAQPLEIKQKKIAWVPFLFVGIALVAAGVAAGFFLSKSASPTTPVAVVTPTISQPSATPVFDAVSQWKTYSNTKYGYSVAFPNDWTSREFADSENGAAFNPVSKPGYPDSSDSVSISAGTKIGNEIMTTLEDYAKTAAIQEIQNYTKLATIKKVTTEDGVVGYRTTWIVQPIMGRGQPSESLPITYFELPDSKTFLVRITLDREEELATYEKMILTVKFTRPVSAVTPSPAGDEKLAIKIAVKELFLAKYGDDATGMEIAVSQVNGDYAKGTVSEQGGGGGGWFAARVNGAWKLVNDGNGVIQCSELVPYPEFPSSMIPECWDETKQTLVKR